MASSSVIQEFLVGLGWKIDEQGQQRFIEALETVKKTALAVTASFMGVVVAVSKVAESYNQLEFSSDRAQSTVAGMQQLAFAVSQVGGNAEAARASLQSIGNFLRSSPGAESFIQRLGVNTRDAEGRLRDTSMIMQDLSSQFRTMPYWQAKASAGVLGIDENTLQAMMRGLGNFGKQYSDIYKAVGVNQDQAARKSVKFMRQFNLTAVAIKALRDRVAVSLMDGIGGDIVKFRNLLISHSREITDTIEKVSHFVIDLSEKLFRMFSEGVDAISGLYNQFMKLDDGSLGWIKTLGELYLGWVVLSTALKATPLGIVFLLGAFILSLYNDYKKWKDGSKSLIDWEKWKPGIDAFTKSIENIMDIFRTMWPNIREWTAPLLSYFKTEFLATFTELGKLIQHISGALDDLLNGRFNSSWDNIKLAFQDLKDFSKKDAEATDQMMQDYRERAAGAVVGAQQKLTGLNFDKVQQAMQYLTSQGIDRVHAIAMIGNWQQESSLDPAKKGPVGHGGLEQWSEDRRDKILKGTGIDVWKANFADAMRAAVWELKNGDQTKNFRNFMKSSNLDSATAAFNKYIEISGESMNDPNMLKRIGYAHNIDLMTKLMPMAQKSVNNSQTINQNITVNGAKDPHATANEIKNITQQAQNNSLVRNMKGRRA